MTDTPDNPSTPGSGAPAASDEATRWPLIVGVLVFLVAVGAALFLFGTDDDDADSVATTAATSAVATTAPPTTEPDTTETPTTTTEASTSTTTSTTTETPETTEAPPQPDPIRPAVWPWADTDTRYADPVEAATGFVTDFLGFDEPLVGEFMAGDARSGEVQVQATDPGPVTTVLLRQLSDDDNWWVIGAVAENIVIDEPEVGAEVSSPLTVSGSALAFEGTVDVELRADGNGEPIFEGFVTGSGPPDPGPYSEIFEFTSPGETGGALVMLSLSPRDGSVLEASALRIFYR